jgi:uncharacterized protein YbaP (TraB family)
MLLHTLNELSKGAEAFNALADAWKKGDVEAVDILVRQGFDAGPTGTSLYKKLLTDRNEAMAERLAEFGKDGRVYFVVLGAGHLGGEKGVIKLLEAKGYKLSQL